MRRLRYSIGRLATLCVVAVVASRADGAEWALHTSVLWNLGAVPDAVYIRRFA
ncbi:MAG: hypothetical protein ABGY41_20365 [Candidatus Poribacteria bacterium]